MDFIENNNMLGKYDIENEEYIVNQHNLSEQVKRLSRLIRHTDEKLLIEHLGIYDLEALLRLKRIIERVVREKCT